jgi:hypothetical protein
MAKKTKSCRRPMSLYEIESREADEKLAQARRKEAPQKDAETLGTRFYQYLPGAALVS